MDLGIKIKIYGNNFCPFADSCAHTRLQKFLNECRCIQLVIRRLGECVGHFLARGIVGRVVLLLVYVFVVCVRRWVCELVSILVFLVAVVVPVSCGGEEGVLWAAGEIGAAGVDMTQAENQTV